MEENMIQETEQAPLTSFEFDISIKEEEEAFILFQKKYVYKRNIIKSIGFGLLGVAFGVSIYRDPSKAINYFLLAVCAAAVVLIWFNNRHIRKTLMDALKILEDDRYRFSLYDDRFVIETIVPEEERNAEDFEPIEPQEMKLDDPMLDAEEQEDKFVLIVQKATIYVLPKRCMSESNIEAVREKLLKQS
ncbi:MAG: hypothetical protein IJ746_05185 [Ruminococcus sp.]|nr:hypothetical protein [Ruminococcus sp.]